MDHHDQLIYVELHMAAANYYAAYESPGRPDIVACAVGIFYFAVHYPL